MFIVMMQVTKSFKEYQDNDEKEYLGDRIVDAEVVETTTANQIEQPTEIEVGLMVAILSKLSIVDGSISRYENAYIEATLKVLSSYFDDASEMREILSDIYKNESSSANELVDVAHQYYQETNFDYKKRLNMLNYILLLVYIDGSYDEKEELIKKIYRTFRVSKSDFENSLEALKSTLDSVETQSLSPIDDDSYNDSILSAIPDVIRDEIDEETLKNVAIVLNTIKSSQESLKSIEDGTNTKE
jgi:uncharacterized tellurite resistance protein B-like protein